MTPFTKHYFGSEQHRKRYEFLRGSTYVVACWEHDSRHRVYLAAGDGATMVSGQHGGFDTANAAIDAAIADEESEESG